MHNILKHFLGPVSDFVFPEAQDLPVDDEPEDQPPEPAPSDLQAPPADEEVQDSPGEDIQEEPGADPGAGAAALFSYARVQADEILAQAQQEAQDVREAARQEGYRQGYEDGMKKAQVEGAAAMERQRSEQAQEVKRFLEQASRAREDLLEKAQDELCDLSIAVAEKIIHISLKSSREVVARMIQTATEKLKRREWVHIYVGGCEARDLAQITPELTTALAGLSDHIKIIPMTDGEEGACIVEMPDEIIDASASTQLGNIRDLLREG